MYTCICIRICIHLFQKTLSERTEIARPKGTVVSTFRMQKQCVLYVVLKGNLSNHDERDDDDVK